MPTAADNAWITNIGTYTVTVPAGTTATASNVTVGGGQRLAGAIDRPCDRDPERREHRQP